MIEIVPFTLKYNGNIPLVLFLAFLFVLDNHDLRTVQIIEAVLLFFLSDSSQFLTHLIRLIAGSLHHLAL